MKYWISKDGPVYQVIETDFIESVYVYVDNMEDVGINELRPLVNITMTSGHRFEIDVCRFDFTGLTNDEIKQAEKDLSIKAFDFIKNELNINK